MRPGLGTEGLARLLGLRRPAWDKLPCGIAGLDDLAVPVESWDAFCGPGREIAFLELAPRSAVTLRPAFMLGEGGAFPRDPQTVPPSRVYRLSGGTRIFGKGLLLSGDTLLTLDPLAFQELGRLDYPANALSFRREGRLEGDRGTATVPRVVREVEGPCLLLAQGGEQVWGHWLVDILPRLALGASLPVAARIVLDSDAPPWAKPLLRRMGVDPRRVVWHDKVRETLLVRDLYVPTFLRLGHAMSPLANLAWNRLGLPSYRPATGKLFVSRTGLKGGSAMANAREVEGAAQARGYTILRPERLSLERQIRVFAEAAIVAGEFGSAMHDTVFGPAGQRVAVLQSAAYPYFIQAGIGAVRAQPTGFAFGPSTDGARGFTLPLAVLHETLDRLEAGRP